MESCETLKQFKACYSTEQACVDYLFRAKWPDGFSCPHCRHAKAYRIGSRRLPLFECARCRHQTSLIAGSIMEGSRTLLSKWFLAIFLVSRTDKGISALSLARMIRVTYKTAWLILHKIRHAMSEATESDKLSGDVHVNSFIYGKRIHPSFDLHPKEQPILAVAAVNERQETIRIVFRPVPPAHLANGRILNTGTDAFIAQYVDPARTDRIFCFTTRYKERSLKKIQPLFRQMNSWLRHTFCGIGRKHLQAYLDEFSTRYNLCLEQAPVFDRLVTLCAKSHRITRSMLTAKTLPREFPSIRNGGILTEQFAPFASIRQFITLHNAAPFLNAS